METAVILQPGFWNDGSAWVAEPAASDEGRALTKFAQDELQMRDICFFQTSGTEGVRKWVGLTKEALMISARAVNAFFDITARDHWLLALPAHHVGGFGILARSFASGSAVSVLEGKWNAAAFVQKFEAAGATLASLVPTQIFDLVAAELRAPATLRAVLVGGGALNAELEAAALAHGWQIHRTYAMTETASTVAAQPRPGAELEVLPIWQVSTDAEGVLSLRGEALALGYAICAEGRWRWEPVPPTGLRTRDRVEIVETGSRRCLRFLGRESGIVKILGELVALAPIQERLDTLRLKLGLQEDAVVCDVPDARKEHALVLVVTQTMSGETAARLLHELNETLRPLERIDRLQSVAAIPRSDLGKVLMPALRTML
ncbi:AMP-binding protein [Prosthecobacter sp.]|uniref:AMP-binding protein n=1 Tax=Prosthecobacter sp. TaxID=1965333 RepID=UPI00378353E0